MVGGGHGHRVDECRWRRVAGRDKGARRRGELVGRQLVGPLRQHARARVEQLGARGGRRRLGRRKRPRQPAELRRPERREPLGAQRGGGDRLEERGRRVPGRRVRPRQVGERRRPELGGRPLGGRRADCVEQRGRPPAGGGVRARERRELGRLEAGEAPPPRRLGADRVEQRRRRVLRRVLARVAGRALRRVAGGCAVGRRRGRKRLRQPREVGRLELAQPARRFRRDRLEHPRRRPPRLGDRQRGSCQLGRGEGGGALARSHGEGVEQQRRRAVGLDERRCRGGQLLWTERTDEPQRAPLERAPQHGVGLPQRVVRQVVQLRQPVRRHSDVPRLELDGRADGVPLQQPERDRLASQLLLLDG